MSTGTTIDSFSGRYRFLSNFFPCEIFYCGKSYPTVEHAFQAAKTLDESAREHIRLQSTPGRAKQLGRMCVLRTDWESVKKDVMLNLLRFKFGRPDLRALLKSTGDFYLVEGNNWGDYFWGVCNGSGENWLGKLLMQVRDEIR